MAFGIDSVSSSASKITTQEQPKKLDNKKDTGFGTSAGALNPNNTRDGSLTAEEARLDAGKQLSETVKPKDIVDQAKEQELKTDEDVSIIA